MRKLFVFALASLTSFTLGAREQEKLPLQLIQTIPMPTVQGRFDHLAVDVDGKRLFVVGADSNTLEVVDLAAGKWVRSLTGFKTPTEPVYAADLNKLFVTSRNDGTIKVFRGDSLEQIDTIKLELGANRTFYDPARKLLYVGYGGHLAGFDYGRVGMIDARNDKLLGDIVVSHQIQPSQALLDPATGRLFVEVPEFERVDVYGKDGRLALTFPTAGQAGDMDLDSARRRLFTAARNAPQTMLVYDADSGEEIAHLPAEGRMNGVYYDAGHKRIYVTCGRELPSGFVFVYQQQDANHYSFLGKVETGPGAGTAAWVYEQNRLYVAVPAHDKEVAAIEYSNRNRNSHSGSDRSPFTGIESDGNAEVLRLALDI